LNLAALLKALPEAEVQGNTQLEIGGLAYDSRKVKPDSLFVAIRGHKTDGHRYIQQAVSNGARVVVMERAEMDLPGSVTRVQVDKGREALSRLSAAFYGCPSRQLYLIGITGTNGKTTTSYLVESVLNAAGYRAGILGTIGYRFASEILSAPVTTPESLELQQLLAEMVKAKITHVVMEASSHALDQGRLGDLRFDQGIFTNLTQDHLDYHRNMEDYFQAKAKLFRQYLKGSEQQNTSLAIINRDDPFGGRLWEELTVPKQDFGLGPPAAYYPLTFEYNLQGISGVLQTPKGRYEFHSPLIGHYNLYNILAAWAVGEELGLEGVLIKKAIEALRQVPGRMEPVPNKRGITVLIDYAHTPEALRFVLQSLRQMTKGRIITVFGCGGDRDPHKRPIMGQIAGGMSHLSVVTSDNPRTEDPREIIDEIEPGLKGIPLPCLAAEKLEGPPPPRGYTLIPDRSRAIAQAIRVAQMGDVVLIAGKGHETYQLVGSQVLNFDDREAAKSSLEELLV
jgi:UDP-N-acetylmuramoyl-L-alanyl-D-glutamate--2,6-diaminopimelate ligase